MIRVDEGLSQNWLTKSRLCGALGLLVILGGSAWVAYARPDFGALAMWGYPGIFLLMFASSATVLLPMPGFAAVIAAGTMGNPLLIALAAGPGSALGEFIGYMIGCSGRAMINERQPGMIRHFERWLRQYGFWALLLLAAIPNPAFDLVGIAAGSLGFPTRKFLVAVLVGNTFKYLFLAYLGTMGISVFNLFTGS